MMIGNKLAAASIHWPGLRGTRKLSAGSWVRLISTGEILYFVGLDPDGNRVFRRRDGEIRVSSVLPLDAFEDLPEFHGWDDKVLDDASLHSGFINGGDNNGTWDNDDDDEEGDDEDDEAIWGIRKKHGHQHTLQVICGTPAQVELDFPVAGGWEIERLSS